MSDHPETSIAAELFSKAEELQNAARDLHAEVTRLYRAAAELKALAITASEQLTAPTSEVVNG